jgi:GntR family transcriptional regulator of arabinose operon
MAQVIDKSSIIPVYVQLEAKLKEAIITGDIKPGGRMPSENALSRKYGIHRHTARKTLKLLAEAGVIVSEPGRGWFVKEIPVVEIVNKTIGLFGIPMGNIHSVFTSSFLNGIMNETASSSSVLKILTAEDISKLCECTYSDKLDSLIWAVPNPEDIPQIEQIKRNGTNVIVANRQLFGSEIPYVAIDQYSGTRELVARLTRAGHTRIGCIISDRPYRYISERWRGFCDALAEARLNVDEQLVLHIMDSTDFSDKLDEYFKNVQDLTALFISGEIFHHQTFEYLKNNNIRIPEDLSVVAFDRPSDTPFGKNIDCLEQPTEEMAAELFKMLNNKVSESMILKPKLVPGKSVKDIQIKN